MSLYELVLGNNSAFDGLRQIVKSYSRPGNVDDILNYLSRPEAPFYNSKIDLEKKFCWMSNFDESWSKIVGIRILNNGTIFRLDPHVRFEKDDEICNKAVVVC
jgi:hypothetical protein